MRISHARWRMVGCAENCSAYLVKFVCQNSFFVSCDSVYYSTFVEDVQDVQNNYVYSSLWNSVNEKVVPHH